MRGVAFAALLAVWTVSASARSALPDDVEVAPGLQALAKPVSCRDFGEVALWASHHGFRLPAGEGVCRNGPASPAVALGWNTAVVWANAFSERSGLTPAYRDAAGAVARDAVTLGIVPTASAETDGYRLPTLADLGRPRLRAMMSREIQEWSDSRIDLGDGRPYYYLCKPGACDFHSSGMSGRGVGFRLVRRPTARR